MRILAATDDAGSFKEVVCAKGTDTSIPASKQPKSIKQFHPQGLKNRIQKLCVVDKKKLLILARCNGQINFHGLEKKEGQEEGQEEDEYPLINTVTLPLEPTKDKFVNLFVLENEELCFAVSELGKVYIIDLTSVKEKDEEQEIKYITTEVKGPVSTFIPHPEQFGIFAYGGKENDVKIIRLMNEEDAKSLFPKNQTKKNKNKNKTKTKKNEQEISLSETPLYEAKNVKNDKLDLRVPIHPSKLQFINLATHTSTSWQLLSVTRYGHVRFYDTTHGRKPKSSHTLTNRPILNVGLLNESNEIICSDDHTMTATFDFTNGKLMGKFKGAVGAVQGVHLSEGLLCTGGLDRYVRVFDVESRETVAKCFVGSKISEVLILDGEDLEEEDEPEQVEDGKKKSNKKKRALEEAEAEDEDEVWNQLEALEKKTSDKKSKKD